MRGWTPTTRPTTGRTRWRQGPAPEVPPQRPDADNLARLTPPLHFQPNPREIEGWHFLADPRACTARPYRAEAGPDEPRRFIFSPAVAQVRDAASPVEAIARYGRGELRVASVRLGKPDRDGCPPIARPRLTLSVKGNPAAARPGRPAGE
ncbi:hypothetical protein [Tepidimonas sediminis]|uniref:hypothetical protein n=1 Tax=Tepidimonas sediminis TaxID=2588941 RepID=UPI0011803F0E|nr:hypothetical protein [Tepidimonas sediminis]